jgi:putative oxidoreductase
MQMRTSFPVDRSFVQTNTGMSSLYAHLDRARPHVLSLVRIVAALLFLQHGLSKFFGFPTPGPPLAGLEIAAASIETFGGLVLAIGLFTRWAALIISGEMAFAYFIAHAPHSFFPLANHGESAVLFCFVFLYFVFAGPGPWSLDRALKLD